MLEGRKRIHPMDLQPTRRAKINKVIHPVQKMNHHLNSRRPNL